MATIIQLPSGRPAPCPDRRPRRFRDGADMAEGTTHVVPAGQAFTICRLVDEVCWWPMTQKVDPAWQTWPTRTEAQAQLDAAKRHPFWGC